MSNWYIASEENIEYLSHYGIKGMKWGHKNKMFGKSLEKGADRGGKDIYGLIIPEQFIEEQFIEEQFVPEKVLTEKEKKEKFLEENKTIEQIIEEGTGITKKTKVRKPTLKEIKDKALNKVKSKFSK